MVNMADVKPIGKALFLREEELRRGIELMFFAYRDFTGEADSILAERNMGRAHHRAIYFIGRHPGITVSNLLTILCITKQSLSRVLSGLMRDGYVIQRLSANDRRQRLLHLTQAGIALESKLTSVREVGSPLPTERPALMPSRGFSEYCKVCWTTVPLPN